MADGIVYLTADFTAAAGTQTSATVERGPAAAGPWTLLATVPLLSQVGSYTDTTAPLDEEIFYRWTGDPGGDVIAQGPFTEDSTGTVLLKDPLRPWANLELSLCATMTQGLAEICGPSAPDLIWVGLGNKVYRADANLFDVYNARVPADIFGVRKRLDGSMRILSKTLAAKDAVETLFAGGGPIQIQTPDIYGFPDIIVQPGDVTEEYLGDRIDQRRALRVWDVPFTAVDAPLGPTQGTECANWCVVAETWPTFADMTASDATWGDIASGEEVCPDGGDTPLAPLIDTFTRVVVDAWGTADTGQAWTISGMAPSNYAVNGTQGQHIHQVSGTLNTLIPYPAADVTVTADWAINAVPLTAGAFFTFVMARAQTTADTYLARVQVAVGGAMTLTIRRRVAGVETQLTTFATGLVYTANTMYTTRLRTDGTTISAKVWLTSGTEPAGWQTTVVDASLALAGNAGIRTVLTAGFTNPPPIILSYDRFMVTV